MPKKQSRGSSSDEASDTETGERNFQCGDFCSFNIFKIPGLLLRNIILPKDMWDDYPNGFDRLADRIVFQPDIAPRTCVNTPEYYQVSDQYEEVFFTTKDNVRLHGYLIKCTSPYKPPPPRTYYFYDFPERVPTPDVNQNEVFPIEDIPEGLYSSLPTVIYFHGNAGNIGMCCDMLNKFKQHPVTAKLNWFLVEYRGYGKSEGKENEKGLYEDGKAAFRYVESRQDLDPKKIIVMGHSMGGAVAIHLASHPRYKKKVAALITENTFTNIPEVAKKTLDTMIIQYLPHCFYSCTFKSIDKIGKVKCPSYFVCAEDDDIVPCQMSEDLHKKCGAKIKYIEKLDDCSHNDTYTCDDYMPRLARFLEQIFNLKTVPTSEMK